MAKILRSCETTAACWLLFTLAPLFSCSPVSTDKLLVFDGQGPIPRSWLGEYILVPGPEDVDDDFTGDIVLSLDSVLSLGSKDEADGLGDLHDATGMHAMRLSAYGEISKQKSVDGQTAADKRTLDGETFASGLFVSSRVPASELYVLAFPELLYSDLEAANLDPEYTAEKLERAFFIVRRIVGKADSRLYVFIGLPAPYRQQDFWKQNSLVDADGDLVAAKFKDFLQNHVGIFELDEAELVFVQKPEEAAAAAEPDSQEAAATD